MLRCLSIYLFYTEKYTGEKKTKINTSGVKRDKPPWELLSKASLQGPINSPSKEWPAEVWGRHN